MNDIQQKKWFQARLRWALLEEGRGLNRWREEEHIFLCQDRANAFSEALRIGPQGEIVLAPDQEGVGEVDCRFAEVSYLEEKERDVTSFTVWLGESIATEAIPFEHVFDPAASMPAEIF